MYVGDLWCWWLGRQSRRSLLRCAWRIWNLRNEVAAHEQKQSQEKKRCGASLEADDPFLNCSLNHSFLNVKCRKPENYDNCVGQGTLPQSSRLYQWESDKK